MLSRLRSLFQLRLQHLYVIESALVGTFFIQALRLLVGLLYSRIASASQYPALDPSLIDRALPGLVEPKVIQQEISVVIYMVALPLITLLFGRMRWLTVPAALIAAVGRYLIVTETSISQTTAAAITVGGGLLYITLLVRHRARVLPYFFILAIAIDQLFRAYGDTFDPSWARSYAGIQGVCSTVTIVLSVATAIWAERAARQGEAEISPDRGALTFWSGLGLGALLFLELALLALPNAIIGRSNTSYAIYPVVVPALVVVTLLPLFSWVRTRIRGLIGLFDSSVRGWSLILLIALLLVSGTRFGGIATFWVLVAAQFCASLIWWWLTRQQSLKERNLTGIWMVVAVGIFFLLVVFDNFTFEYAFVRDFSSSLNFLNEILPPILRGFRGLGLAVLLLSVLLAGLPVVQSQRRIPLTEEALLGLPATLALVASCGIAAALYARPPVVVGVSNPEIIRIGTYNIHGGYNEFFYYDLEQIAQTIDQSGANIVLLQEVETGRLTSFGVDQALWLARRVGRDARFFATNEGLQGLAVLSNIEIVYDDGSLLTSVGTQTGLQRVQVRPDANVITVYNTWLGVLLESDTERSVIEQERDQAQQLNEIFALLAVQNPGDQLARSRTVVGGTFNNIPDSPLMMRMREVGFIDPFAGYPLEVAATYWRTGQRARLDYLWLTNSLWAGVEQAGVIETSRASDHRLAVIQVRLR